jgi:hypothetical protein
LRTTLLTTASEVLDPPRVWVIRTVVGVDGVQHFWRRGLITDIREILGQCGCGVWDKLIRWLFGLVIPVALDIVEGAVFGIIEA